MMDITLKELNLLIDWWEFFELKGLWVAKDKALADKLLNYDARIKRDRGEEGLSMAVVDQ